MAQRKKKVKDEAVKSDPSVVLFLSLMIIMLAFFILLNSMAKPDDERRHEAIGSLFGTFGIVPRGHQGIEATGALDDFPFNDDGEPVMELTNQLNEIRGVKDLPGDILVEVKGRDFRVVLSGDLVFGPGEVVLTGAAAPIIDLLVERLARTDKPIRIAGHAAQSPEELESLAGGTLWEISIRRALTLSTAMTARGIPEERLIVSGFGATRPLMANDTETGRLKNRRVEITVIGGAKDSRLLDGTHTLTIKNITIEPFWKKWLRD